MHDNLPCRKTTLGTLEGRRVGRPNLRWMDGVKRDAERLGIRSWRTRAMDRDGWRLMIELVKTPAWVVVPGMMMMMIDNTRVLGWFLFIIL